MHCPCARARARGEVRSAFRAQIEFVPGGAASSTIVEEVEDGNFFLASRRLERVRARSCNPANGDVGAEQCADTERLAKPTNVRSVRSCGADRRPALGVSSFGACAATCGVGSGCSREYLWRKWRDAHSVQGRCTGRRAPLQVFDAPDARAKIHATDRAAWPTCVLVNRPADSVRRRPVATELFQRRKACKTLCAQDEPEIEEEESEDGEGDQGGNKCHNPDFVGFSKSQSFFQRFMGGASFVIVVFY